MTPFSTSEKDLSPKKARAMRGDNLANVLLTGEWRVKI